MLLDKKGIKVPEMFNNTYISYTSSELSSCGDSNCKKCDIRSRCAIFRNKRPIKFALMPYNIMNNYIC